LKIKVFTDYEGIILRLKSLANPSNLAGMARYGINIENTLGVSMPTVRSLAKEIGKNHELAQQLWDSRIHEASILASLVDAPRLVTEKQMEDWVADLDSWDVCDQLCQNLFALSHLASEKAVQWSQRDSEFVKRAGFVIMARMALGSARTPDKTLLEFLEIIRRESGDKRNMVKKAVNWALRQTGKHNRFLNGQAIEAAHQIQKMKTKSGCWIAADAIKELTSEAVQKRLEGK
jgi:3-methyladenine DNA glycosylase AlkD